MEKIDYIPFIAGNAVQHHNASSYHRRWLFVDANNHAILGHQKLQQLIVDIKFGFLVLQAPEMMRFDIPLDIIEDDDDSLERIYIDGRQITAVNEGEVAAVWATKFLGQAAKIVKIHPPEQDY